MQTCSVDAATSPLAFIAGVKVGCIWAWKEVSLLAVFVTILLTLRGNFHSLVAWRYINVKSFTGWISSCHVAFMLACPWEWPEVPTNPECSSTTPDGNATDSTYTTCATSAALVEYWVRTKVGPLKPSEAWDPQTRFLWYVPRRLLHSDESHLLVIPSSEDVQLSLIRARVKL